MHPRHGSPWVVGVAQSVLAGVVLAARIRRTRPEAYAELGTDVDTA
ncbi:hypothetical protein ACFUTV_02150 [Streptomyces sp. NPDC057298]